MGDEAHDIPEKPLHVVCYLDMLGYGEFVNEHNSNPAIVSRVESAFANSLKTLYDLRGRRVPYENEFSLALQAIAQHINARLISDSLPLQRLPRLGEADTTDENLVRYLIGFFMMVSHLYLGIAADLAYFFRGAISVGRYYESHPLAGCGKRPPRLRARGSGLRAEADVSTVARIDPLSPEPSAPSQQEFFSTLLEEHGENNLFVFSPTLVEAVRLERRTARYPRVVIGQSTTTFISQLQSAHAKSLKERRLFFYNRQCCLNLYYVLEAGAKGTRITLRRIRDGIVWQVGQHAQEANVIEKYRWLAEYHNGRVPGLGYPELRVNVDAICDTTPGSDED